MKEKLIKESSSSEDKKSNQILAIDEENKKGYINYSRAACFINYMYVKEAYRNQGIGTVLFNAAINDLFAYGCKEVSLNAFNDTYSFFEKRGAKFRPGYSFASFEDDDHLVGMVIEKPGLS